MKFVQKTIIFIMAFGVMAPQVFAANFVTTSPDPRNVVGGNSYVGQTAPIVNVDVDDLEVSDIKETARLAFNFGNNDKSEVEETDTRLAMNTPDAYSDNRDVIRYDASDRNGSSSSRDYDSGRSVDDAYSDNKNVIARGNSFSVDRNIGTASVINSQAQANAFNGETNYGLLLLVIVMLAVIVFLARMTLRKRNRINNNYARPMRAPRRPAPMARRRMDPRPVNYAQPTPGSMYPRG